jgi:hypothetical protein
MWVLIVLAIAFPAPAAHSVAFKSGLPEAR